MFLPIIFVYICFYTFASAFLSSSINFSNTISLSSHVYCPTISSKKIKNKLLSRDLNFLVYLIFCQTQRNWSNHKNENLTSPTIIACTERDVQEARSEVPISLDLIQKAEGRSNPRVRFPHPWSWLTSRYGWDVSLLSRFYLVTY